MSSNELIFTPQRLDAMRAEPSPGFMMRGKLRNPQPHAVSILQFSAAVRLDEPYVRIQTSRPFKLGLPIIEPGKSMDVELEVDFTMRALRAVEEARGSKSEILLQLEFHCVAAETSSISREGRQHPEVVSLTPYYAAVRYEAADGHPGPQYRISRDEWIGFLKASRFADLEVFELPRLEIAGRTVATEAYGALAQAQNAFRAGNPEETLSRCRGAFEAVATSAGQSDDVKAGFAALLEQVLSHTKDEPKREPLSDLVLQLAKFQHLGRHLKFPFTPVDRDDALLSLRITLALFEYFDRKRK